jgi:hypothetical protein
MKKFQRPDNEDLEHIVAYLEDAVSRVEKAKTTTHCIDCLHFIEGQELCTVANSRPPARVIVSGCPKFLEDIPF